MKPVRILRSAQADIRAEKVYYGTISPQLSERFLTAVELAVRTIPQHPLAMRVLEYGIRRWPVDRGFMHGVLYRVEEEAIIVLAVFHPKQNPEKWKARAKAQA